MTKKLRFFTGPNGSGKTTLIKKISEYFEIGYLINADNIEAELKDKGYIIAVNIFPIRIYFIRRLKRLTVRL